MIFQNRDLVKVALYRYARDGRYGELLEQVNCELPKGVVKIPKGFKTDFASIPRFFYSIITPIGKHTLPAILHDYLYANGAKIDISRKEADKIFYNAMLECSVNKCTAWIMWASVRAFGFTSYKKGLSYERESF